MPALHDRRNSDGFPVPTCCTCEHIACRQGLSREQCARTPGLYLHLRDEPVKPARQFQAADWWVIAMIVAAALCAVGKYLGVLP